MKISKDTEDLYNIVNQLDLLDIYRALHPATAKDKCSFPSVCRIFTKIEHLTDHKKLDKYQWIQVLQSIFSEQSGIKL